MAFPSIRSQVASGNEETTSHSITYPSSVGAGDLLLCFVASDGDNTFDWANATSPTSGGWTKLYEVSTGDSQTCLSVGYAKADGDEASGTLTLSSGSSEESAARMFAIQDAADPDVSPPLPSAEESSEGSATVTFPITYGLQIIDIQGIRSGNPAGFGRLDNEKHAIKLTGDGNVADMVVAYLRKKLSPTDKAQLGIYTDSSGEPGSLISGAYVQIDESLLSGSFEWFAEEFTTPPTLSDGTTYWLVFERTGSLSDIDYYDVAREANVPGEDSKWLDDGTWYTSSYDPYFVVGNNDARDCLWFIGVAYDDDDGGFNSGTWPTNYSTNGQYDVSSATSGNCSLDTSYRTNNAASEDPGDGTAPTAEEWVSVVIGVVPGEAGPPPSSTPFYFTKMARG